jgi:hypothetical protein
MVSLVAGIQVGTAVACRRTDLVAPLTSEATDLVLVGGLVAGDEAKAVKKRQ